MKVKLVRPPVMMSFPANIRMPYGMGVVTAALRRKGIETDQDDLFVRVRQHNKTAGAFSGRVINLGLMNFHRDLERLCLRDGLAEPRLAALTDQFWALTRWEGYDVVGFSMHCASEFRFALLLAEKLKAETGAKVVFGGPFITLHANFYFPDRPAVDFMVAGEGHRSLPLLLDALAGKGTLAGVPGLWYRENGAVRSNPPEPGPLEDVPLPDFDGLPLEGYRQEVFEASPFLPYQTSRGCPGNCAFCTFSRVHFGRALESKSPAKVVSELKEYSARYGSRYFSMCDECFNNIPEKAAAICDAIAAAGLGLRWEAFVRFNTLDEALLRKMKAAGCALIKVGIESGSDRVLAAMRKGLTAAQAQKAIELCRAAGIKVRAYFIIGYPGETDADVDATIAFIERNAAAIDSFSLYRFRVEYPSEIWAAPEKFGLEDLKMRHPHFQYGEAGGRRWPELARDKNRSLARVMKAVYGKVLAGRYRVGPLPLLAFLLCEKLCDIGRGGAWRWLPRWALDAVYTLDPRYFDGTMGRYAAYVTRDLFPFSRSDAKKSGGVFPLLDPGPE